MWAVLIATKSRWRFLVILHPIITLAAIVLTANHYWLDAFAATVLVAFGLGVDHLIERRRRRKLELRAQGDDGIAESGERSAPRSSDPPSTYRPRAPHAPVGSSAARSHRARSRD
jgi:hypothetical protein